MSLGRSGPVETALVLAAGLGERLRPLTYTKPKPLLPLGGIPLVHYPLRMLRSAGVRRVVINLHHLGSQIERALGNGSALGLEITYAPEPVLLNTGGPLVAQREFFGDRTFWVANSDTILDFDLGAMVEFHRRHRALATLALRPRAHGSRYSAIETDPEGRVHNVRLTANGLSGSAETDEGVQPGYPMSVASGAVSGAPTDARDGVKADGYVFCGLTLCEPAIIRFAPKRPAFGIVSDLLAPMVAQGEPIYGYAFDGYFRTVDDLDSYEALDAEFAAAAPGLSYLSR
jgi:NDP-sugar pyrophosphorylase family protein